MAHDDVYFNDNLGPNHFDELDYELQFNLYFKLNYYDFGEPHLGPCSVR